MIEARYLPGILQEFASLIGLAGTLRIVETYGGVRLYVPKTVDGDHDLARLIGLEAARKLAAEYGGEMHMDIPRAVAATRAAFRASIRADRAAGLTHRELALKYKMTERHIRNILGVKEEDDRQVALF
jgi:hypothetical protein